MTVGALEGLIGLSGAQAGELGRALAADRDARAPEVLDYWRTLLPQRFYVELQRLGRPGESAYLGRAVELASARSVPVVATNDVCFLGRDDFEAHETRVCIGQGATLDDPSRARQYSEEQYLKSAPEMAALFSDLPEALANTVEIAKRCSLELDLGRVFLPDFAADDGSAPRAYLKSRAEHGLDERLRQLGIAAVDEPRYRERLARELEVIVKMGFEGYFLIVADFIAWARANSIPVGPGRGSGVGSLAAYALGITNLDPLAHDLIFERFLNPERVSLPDFDIDFCIEGRDRVIDYVSGRYGKERVSQIATYGTMAAKAVVRDVGRVLGMPYGYVDRIAKLIPFEIGITLDKALADDPELRAVYEKEDEVRGLIDLAKQLEGLARTVGTHAGGVVIAPEPLTEYMPLYAAESGMLSQLDKDDLESIGLIKFDFLGLKTLTVIDKALAAINVERAKSGEAPVDIDAIPMDDAKTYDLLRHCRTTAVFQLESLGMRDLIKKLQPDRFDDLTAIVALFRPGPMQMATEFINRKHRKDGAVLDYLHPKLEGILKPTYGVILYQEQVMQIAQVLAGYSLGGADLLRRAMGKKKPEEMAKQREVFVKGADRARSRGRACGIHLQPDGDVRGLRIQQVARGRLRADRVSDRMAQGAFHRGLHGGRAHGRHRQHRPARRAQGRLQAIRHRARAAGREHLGIRVHRPRPAPDPLWPRRAERRRPKRGRRNRERARSARTVQEHDRSLPSSGFAKDQPACARGAGALGRARCARPEPRDAQRRDRRRAPACGAFRARERGRPGRALRRRRERQALSSTSS